MCPVKRLRRGHRDEAGAVAILVAMLAVVLFGAAALAVELGDMFSRDRAVQTSADLAAFAGSQELPDTCTAFTQALAALNDPSNGVRTDNGTSNFVALAADMKDGNRANGEIEILGPTDARVTTCTATGRKVRVVTPPRNVKFAFGAAIKGASAGNVQGVAAVELRGLDVSLLPLSLPANCPSGPNYIYVDNGGIAGGPSAATSPAYSPAGGGQGPLLTGLAANDANVPTSFTVTVTALKDDPTSSPVVFDFHLLNGDGTTHREPGAAPNGISGVLVTGSVTGGGNNWGGQFQVGVPTTVSTTPGSWKVRALQAAGFNKWTPDDSVSTLVVGVASVAGCPNPSNGDFGLLNSPRSDGGSAQQQRFRNFAQGIDHRLVPLATTTPNLACSSDGDPYPDGILDDNTPARGDESCIDVKPGETSTLPTDGIIDGRGGEPGRFTVGTPGVTKSGNCRVAGRADLSWTSKRNKVLWNTVLSCYLAPGRTLADVAAGTPGSLVATIADDPRFFFTPVTDTTTRPKNSVEGAQFWPINSFRAAFATNEKTGGDATCVAFDDCNGLLFSNGGTQLKAIQAFTFPLAALPTAVDQPGNGGDYYGGTKDFLLVE